MSHENNGRAEAGTEEFITIIAPTANEAFDEFHSGRFAEQGFIIASRVTRHRVSVVGEPEASDFFERKEMFVATFSRRVAN